jgi:transposase
MMDSNDLADENIINGYKGQQTVERGYRFLKDPQFFTSSFFLKKPERISALIMVMTLALLVYSIAQKRLSEAMRVEKTTLPNQIGQEVESLTIRRAFQVLRGINLVTMNIGGVLKTVVHGLTELKSKIVRLLGLSCIGYYRLEPS